LNWQLRLILLICRTFNHSAISDRILPIRNIEEMAPFDFRK
jgi:hypothetical protein